jgi:hypothetical protein
MRAQHVIEAAADIPRAGDAGDAGADHAVALARELPVTARVGAATERTLRALASFKHARAAP